MTYVLLQITLVKEFEKETARAVSNVCHSIMSLFEMLVAGFPSLKGFFDPSSRALGVIERGVALGQVLLQVFWSTAINY
jgi:hypothetical protein